MFCPNCGNKIDDNAKFCENCGAATDDNPKIINSEISELNAVASVKKKSSKPIIIAIIIIVAIGIFACAGVIAFDKITHNSGDEKIQKVQDSYFEFLPEITIGELLNSTHHKLNDSSEMWLYDSDTNTIEFYGYSNDNDICMIIDFTGKTENDIAKISSRKINLDKTGSAEKVDIETFETYILNLYAQLDDSYQKTTQPVEKQITTTKVTTTTTNTTTTTKEKTNDKTYSITFEADELIEEAGLQLNGHVGVAVLSNLTCSNGNANIETETIYIYDSLVRVEVTGAEAGEVVLGGTITTYGLDMYQGETVSYPDDSGVFLVSKTVGKASEEKTIIELNTPVLKTNCYPLTIGDGSCIEITWDEIPNADGYYISYMVEYNGDAATITNKETKQSNNVWYEKGSSPIYVYNFSVKAYANINGKEVCSQWSDFVAISNNDYVSQQVEENNLNMKGQINCHGGTVAGFTTDYVVNGGAVGKVRNSLGDKWHVTAKNACYNYGVTWYELWDSDDGDYYGWVDSNYIDFY